METGSGVNDSGTVRFDTEKENIMNKDFDQAKGKVKQAVGDLTGNKDLKARGKADEAAGKVKEFLDDAKDKVDDVVDKVKDTVTKNRHH